MLLVAAQETWKHTDGTILDIYMQSRDERFGYYIMDDRGLWVHKAPFAFSTAEDALRDGREQIGRLFGRA